MELLNLLMRCQRMYLICFIGQAVGLIFCSVLLQRRRSIFKLAVFTAIKSIIVVTSDLCLSSYYPEEDWAKVFSMFISTFGSIATCMMFVYTYYGGALKCVLGTVFAELVTGIVMLPSMIIVNAVEGRSDLFLFYGDFEILDWMLIGVVGVLGALLYKVSASFLRRFRTYSIRHKYLLWGMIAVYVAASQWMAIIDIRNDRAFMAAIYFLFLGGSLFVLAALIIIFRKYKNSVRNRNDFLHLQMELIASQYASLLGQMKYIEQCQNMIDGRIAEVTGKYTDVKQDTVADTYLKHLKKEYNTIRAGIYCKDWLVDAVLYCQMEAAKKLGITVSCDMQGYRSGMVSDQILAAVLMTLFELGFQSCEYQEVHGGSCLSLAFGVWMNKLTVKFVMSSNGKKRMDFLKVKKTVRQQGATMEVRKSEREYTILITLANKDKRTGQKNDYWNM